MGWALVALLALAAGVTAWQDPRRLRIGVYLTLAIGLAVVGLLGRLALLIAGSDDPLRLAWALLIALGVAFSAVVVLGLASVANGILMIRREGRRPANLLSLVFGLGVLGYCALIVVMWWVDRNHTDVALELFFWIVAIGVPLGYLAFVFVAFVGYGLLYGWAADRWARPVDAVIVLGAGLSGERVTPLLASRLDRGRQALERSRSRGKDTHLICSGGQGPDEVVPEAVAMANHLAEQGVDRDLLWLEDASTSTEENLRFSARVAAEHGVESGRFAVVTNDFHVLRAALLLHRMGLEGHGLGARTARYFWPSAILREYAAILWEHRRLNTVLLALSCVPMALLLVRTVASWT
ncbi:YdcF family protein [Aeromicrobium sp. JJY06]|uniref:YdcF family protein n=1 Tax=Aeromicrobium sp. JJY06 TaxID=3373478 RepID=UPI00376F1968